jgi:hypothetical protein
MRRESDSSRNAALTLMRRRIHVVMAGLVPAIHELSRDTKNVDARDKPGHDEVVATSSIIIA